jgi:HAMP domain-containing protein/two-component sensor histidine kinase
MLLVTGMVGFSTLFVVIMLSAQASKTQLAAVQKYISEGISSKGKTLTENHAIALRGLTLDNAFLDMRRLVDRAVQSDEDLVYGLYVNSDRETLAYSRRGAALDGEQAVTGDAWRSLGLAESELLVRTATARRTARLGQDLLEVAAPVLGENSEVIGTVRYGFSTRRMQEALTRASAEARARLVDSVALIGVMVGVASLVAFLLSRVQAVRITEPVDALPRAAEKLASGDRAVNVKIESGDELERLGASFNHMVEDLDSSYRSLEEMNRTLEHKVAARTTELSDKNRDMRRVLDNVDQGFLTLSPSGMMALEHSRVLGEWFGEYDAPLPFWDYLGRASHAFGLEFHLGWGQVEDDILPLEVALSQLPERLSNAGRTFAFQYLPFHRDEKLEGVLVVVAEITERLAREREEADQGELMQGFKRLMLDRSGFELFLRDASEMVDAVTSHRLEGDLVLLKRTLHTLKGNAASMGLTVVARLCHLLEEQLAAENVFSERTLSDLTVRWQSICQHIGSFSGASGRRVIEVPEAEYSSLVSRLSTEAPVGKDLLHQLLSWQLESAERPLRRLAEQASALARRLDKGDLHTVVEAGNVRLDPEAWSPFFGELSHLIRNAVDHGLETPADREASGKPRQGTLVLKAQVNASTLSFEIGDDGRGIDWNAVATAAKNKGLPSASPEQLFAALCTDGVTTRAQASAESGRGVGMAVVRQRIERMGGRLEARSAQGAGTTFIIRFPWSGKDVSAGKPRRPAEAQAAPVRAVGS